MFTHEELYRIALLTAGIDRKNRRMKKAVYAKGETGQDVVTGSDFENEKELRLLLKAEVPGLGYIYGEENGFETVGRGDIGALIDPIDGTRAYTEGLFYSAVSVAFVGREGKTAAGYLLLINNQSPRSNPEIWTFDGSTARRNMRPVRAAQNACDLRQTVVSVTSVAGFSDRQRAIAALIFKLASDRSRGPASICSGAAEIMCVVNGRLGAFINPGVCDAVSHPVALEIAKCLGLYVRHVFEPGCDFSVSADLKSKKLIPGRDMSVVVAPVALKEEIDGLLRDAGKIYDNVGDML